MAQFTDNSNRTWQVTIGIAELKLIKAETGLNLANLFAPGVLDKLMGDYVMVVDVMAIACRGAIAKAGITYDDFQAAITGDALGNAADAILAACAELHPKHVREALQDAFKKAKDAEEMAFVNVLAALKNMTPESILAETRTAAAGVGTLATAPPADAKSA